MDQLNSPILILTKEHITQLIIIAEQNLPNEACGIIAGRGQISLKIYQISNSLLSPTEFLMEPKEMVKTFWEIEKNELEPVAFFHSHPTSPPVPSPTDLKRNYYPETPHLIIGRDLNQWSVRGYLLSRENFDEVLIKTT